MGLKLRKTKYIVLILTKIDIQRPEVEVASKNYSPLHFIKIAITSNAIRNVSQHY